MRKAYEYVLGAIGMDMDSTSIWQDYLEFLKVCAGSAFGVAGQKLNGHGSKTCVMYRAGKQPTRLRRDRRW